MELEPKSRKRKAEEIEEDPYPEFGLPPAGKAKPKKRRSRKPTIRTSLVKKLRAQRKEFHSKLCQINRDLTALGAKHKKLKCK